MNHIHSVRSESAKESKGMPQSQNQNHNHVLLPSNVVRPPKLVVLADLNVDPPEVDEDDSPHFPPPPITTFHFFPFPLFTSISSLLYKNHTFILLLCQSFDFY